MKQYSKFKKNVVIAISIIFSSGISLSINAQETKTKKENRHYENIKHDEHEHDNEHQNAMMHGHDHENYKKCFVAVHGATLFQAFDYKEGRFEYLKGSPKEWSATATIPMFAVAMGYKFSEKTDILAKIEFEYGGFGGHQHIHEHGGHVHMGIEKSGAVIVERVYLTHAFTDAFKIRIGHMPIPMGQVYLAHEPTSYLANINGKADENIIPREWQETGLSILGNLSNHFKYQLMAVTGFDADYFSPHNFVSLGRQNQFEKIFITSPAIVGRIEYNKNGWNMGMANYWNATDLNAQDQSHKGRNINVNILELDMTYKSPKWHLITNFIHGTASNTERLDRPIAKKAMSASCELGYNLNANQQIFNQNHSALWLFGRVDYSNPMMKMPSDFESDIRAKELSFSGGINLFINEHVALKADYEYIKVGNEKINNEQIISLGAVFSFMPFRK